MRTGDVDADFDLAHWEEEFDAQNENPGDNSELDDEALLEASNMPQQEEKFAGISKNPLASGIY
jgi:hypothetical protein